jgi:hypothetical protein
MDMRYHWLADRVRQKQSDVYWRPGRENLGDYHTKHHSAQHHKGTPTVRAHGRTDKSKQPEIHPTMKCARACVLCLNTEPKYYYCTITLVMT